MDLYPVIMAGGVGTRFWPLSRRSRPKQFLPIVSERTMVEETVFRLLPEVPISNIYTIANPGQSQAIRDLIPGLPEGNLLVEPQGKNTAPSLLLASATIYLKNRDAVVAALPADHLIQDTRRFLKKLVAAAHAAAQGPHLVTFGIPPAFPATGYGYIQFSQDRSQDIDGEAFFKVQAFKEKPDQETAAAFLKAGNYAWNSGMFVWRASVFAEKLDQYAPGMFAYWTQILEALRDGDGTRIASIFAEIPSLSIDYALMEKAQGVLMARGDFGWSDVGAWSALADILPGDKAGNTVRGKAMILDSEGCLVYNPKKFTALVGVKDLIVVDTPDVLLICRKDQDQRVKDIVAEIQKKGENDYL